MGYSRRGCTYKISGGGRSYKTIPGNHKMRKLLLLVLRSKVGSHRHHFLLSKMSFHSFGGEQSEKLCRGDYYGRRTLLTGLCHVVSWTRFIDHAKKHSFFFLTMHFASLEILPPLNHVVVAP